MMKKMLVLGWMLCGAAAAWAEDLPCSAEFRKMGEATHLMSSPDMNEAKALEAQGILDEWQPKYQACMDDYGQEHGNNARADLEVKLASVQP